LQSQEFRQPWFLFLHLWELHHHRHILPAYSSREYGRNRYERALSSLDAELAPLLAVLPQNTLIVIHGDHGERVVKTDLQYRLYRLSRDLLRRTTAKREGHEMDVSEELIRVPLVFTSVDGHVHPGVHPGAQVGQLVRQIDALPTVLNLVGAPVPTNIHGQSLLPALENNTALSLEAYLEAFLRIRSDPRNRRVGWRTEEWKYIYAPQNSSLRQELYHLPSDPQERQNVATRWPDVVALLRQRIESLQQGPIAANPGQVMSPEEQAQLEKRLVELGYM
jgi:arylsulfatase A-like enzyme